MSAIDPTKISAIFRALAIKASDQARLQESKKETELKSSPLSRAININRERDKEKLKKNLKQQLTKLKKVDGEYEKKASNLVVKEILLWEFGDDFIAHPLFNLISQNISEKLLSKKNAQVHFHKFLDDLISE